MIEMEPLGPPTTIDPICNPLQRRNPAPPSCRASSKGGLNLKPLIPPGRSPAPQHLQGLSRGKTAENRGLLFRGTTQMHRARRHKGITTLSASHLHRTPVRPTGRQRGWSDKSKAENGNGLQRAEAWHQMSS
jgi:hypothetical protein